MGAAIASMDKLSWLLVCWLIVWTHAQEQQIQVSNRLGQAIDLYWVHPTSPESVFQFTLEPEAIQHRSSFVGHRFSARAAGTETELTAFSVVQGVHEVPLSEGSHTCSTPPECTDRHKDCVAKARRDLSGCQESPGWMTHFCASTCDTVLESCELSDPRKRCPRHILFEKHNISTAPAFAPNSGELQRFFDTVEQKWGQYGAKLVSTNPPVAVFDHFLTAEEALAIRSAAGLSSFKRSTAQGTQDASGYTHQDVTTTRTSTNAWCMWNCEKDATVLEVTSRISRVTQVPNQNFESMQLLRYQTGQFYMNHHDNGSKDGPDPAGPRVLTFFLYLSDVDSGGETEFTALDPPLKIKPQMGRAVVWPSVLDDMVTPHPLTWHKANPVGPDSEKFAANAWIHQYNYKISQLWGCTGSFSD